MEEPTTRRWFGLGSSIVPVVQPSQSRMRKDVTGGYGASSSVWCSLPESEMCAVLVVVANILRDATFQVAFVNCDDVIQEITPSTPYPALCGSILPRTFERSAERIHPQGSNRCGTPSPYLASRSKMTNLGADPNGNASRNCWTIHELVGCFVTLKCRIRRRS